MSPSLRAIDRIMDSILTEDLAAKFIDLKADRELTKRLDELGHKCHDATLTSDEKDEYETYVVANEYIAILQAKARGVLKHQRA